MKIFFVGELDKILFQPDFVAIQCLCSVGETQLVATPAISDGILQLPKNRQPSSVDSVVVSEMGRG